MKTIEIKKEWLNIDGNYQCPYCERTISKYGIKNHIKLKHTEEGQLFCKQNSNFKSLKGKSSHNKGKKTPEHVKTKIADSVRNNPNCTGKAKTAEAELERRNRISKNGKGKIGGYRERSGRGKKGRYKGYWCDSSWELAFVIYNIDHNVIFQRNNQKFDYEFENEKLFYIPDFIMEDGLYVEIKNYNTPKTIAKHNQFPHKLKVICGFEEIKSYLDYVINKYGEDFIRLYED